MNAPKYLRILKSNDVKFNVDEKGRVIVDNEDGTFTDITKYSESKFYKFLGY